MYQQPLVRNIDQRLVDLFKVEVSETIRVTMKNKNVSSEKIAASTGLPPSTVRTIRRDGSGTLLNIALIFKVLGLSIDSVIANAFFRCRDKGIKCPTTN